MACRAAMYSICRGCEGRFDGWSRAGTRVSRRTPSNTYVRTSGDLVSSDRCVKVCVCLWDSVSIVKRLARSVPTQLVPWTVKFEQHQDCLLRQRSIAAERCLGSTRAYGCALLTTHRALQPATCRAAEQGPLQTAPACLVLRLRCACTTCSDACCICRTTLSH